MNTLLPAFPTDWQTVVSLACVCAAAGYIAYRIWQVIWTTGSTKCSRCDRVPIRGVKQTPIVTEDSLRESAAKDHVTPSPTESS